MTIRFGKRDFEKNGASIYKSGGASKRGEGKPPGGHAID
jgi:hypothetical protein